MKKFLVLAAMACVASSFATKEASAGFPGNYGFFPWGFYQPYGAMYSNSIRTPPYFSLNPPVYYGARHARPYGLSPFASPPLVQAGDQYRTRLRSDFLEPVRETPEPAIYCNPCVSSSGKKKAALKISAVQPGPVRANPFASDADKLERVAQN